MNAKTSIFGAATLFLLSVLAAGCTTQTTSGASAAAAVTEAASQDAAIEIIANPAGGFQFHILSGNGELLLQSREYETRDAATSAIKGVLDASLDGQGVEILQADSESYFFNVRDAEKAIVGTSEMYVSEASARRAVDSLKRISASAIPAASEPAQRATIQVVRHLLGSDTAYSFQLRLANGAVVFHSVDVASNDENRGAQGAAMEAGGRAGAYVISEAAGGAGQFFFALNAADGTTSGATYVVGRSGLFDSKASAESARDAMMELVNGKDLGR